MMGEDSWLTDPRFKDDEARGNHAEDLSKRVSEWTMQRTTEQALKELDNAKIPAGPLYTPQQALDDAHIRQAGLLADTDYPGVARRVPLAPTPVDLSDTPGRFRQRAPMLGEHTNAILGEIGYSAAEIDALRRKGVV
jgi:crotonobetainyl-CoA:carnitine CoA-transferase CaiB-like acyl-CoA transferase